MPARTALCICLILVSLTSGRAALAQTGAGMSPADEILSTLRTRGYAIVEHERTWLGRERVLAEKDGMRRELVFIPGTGEILRDYAARKETPGGPGEATSPGAMGAPRSAASDAPAATPSDSVGDPVSVGAVGVSSAGAP